MLHNIYIDCDEKSLHRNGIFKRHLHLFIIFLCKKKQNYSGRFWIHLEPCTFTKRRDQYIVELSSSMVISTNITPYLSCHSECTLFVRSGIGRKNFWKSVFIYPLIRFFHDFFLLYQCLFNWGQVPSLVGSVCWCRNCRGVICNIFSPF